MHSIKSLGNYDEFSDINFKSTIIKTGGGGGGGITFIQYSISCVYINPSFIFLTFYNISIPLTFQVAIVILVPKLYI